MSKIFRIAGLILALTFLLIISGCGNSSEEIPVDNSVVTNASGEDVRVATKEEIEAYQKSTAENDTDIGLRSTKIDLAAGELTDDQKLVLEYFKSDYMFVNSIEALQRYPQIFDNALIEFYAKVEKILDSNSDTYTALVCMLQNSNEAYESYYNMNSYDVETRYMVIRGQQSNKRVMTNDIIKVSGRYKGTDSYTIDGSSFVVPTISEHYIYILNDSSTESGWNDFGFYPSRFEANEMKAVAKSIFGDNITVTRPDLNIEEDYQFMMDNTENVYVCILDDQSSSKFSRYYFVENMGELYDAKSGRYIEFSADFQHFFLFTYDYTMETLTLEYYDHDLNKIWKREFEETISAQYDFTKNNVYLQANNELYVMNIETGEDTYLPTYVGSKIEIRKMRDGVLLIGTQKSDAIIKTDLEGKMMWKLNLQTDVYMVDAVQIIDNRLLITYLEEWGGNTHYVVIDNATGELIQDAVLGLERFHQYS